MNSAKVELRFATLAPQLKQACNHFEDEVRRQAEAILWVLGSRPCHAERARKLRRRGMDVRPDGFTSTGRRRYRWARPMPTIVGDES